VPALIVLGGGVYLLGHMPWDDDRGRAPSALRSRGRPRKRQSKARVEQSARAF